MKSLADNRFAAAVYVYNENDYRDRRLFLTADGLAGAALHGDEIVSVFSSRGRRIGPHLIAQAVSQGGRRLDAIDTVLPQSRGDAGFVTVSRLPGTTSKPPRVGTRRRAVRTAAANPMWCSCATTCPG